MVGWGRGAQPVFPYMPRDEEVVKKVVGSRGEEDSRGHAALWFFPPTQRRERFTVAKTERCRPGGGEKKRREWEGGRDGRTVS